MSMRNSVPSNVDASVFRNTAVQTKKVNVNPTMMRGGIRL